MTKFQRISSKTVIIQPGSTVLRIGLASDEEPKTLLHCIARESKNACPGRIPSLSSQTSTPRDIEVSNLSFGPSPHSDSFVMENKFYKILNSDVTNFSNSLDDPRPAFIPFLKGLIKSVGGGYQLHWPIVSGCFNEEFTPSLNLQNLEDMWTYALEKYVCFGVFPR